MRVREYSRVWEREPTQMRAGEPAEVCRGELTWMCMRESSRVWVKEPFRSGHRAESQVSVDDRAKLGVHKRQLRCG